MIKLHDVESGALLGTITEEQLKVLAEQLEEESPEDRDYYIDAATIDLLADGRATDHLVKLLREAVGEETGVEIRWQER